VLKLKLFFFESTPQNWEEFKFKIPIIQFLEAGSPSHFKYVIPKPVFLHRLISLLHGFRYNVQLTSNEPQVIDSNLDKPKKVLVAEDNKANQFVMEKILRHIQIQYEIAEDGCQAINKLEDQSFDLVFMDCQMPVLDGIEATKRIRKSGKPYSNIPIVALTANAIEGDEDTCREAGMNGHLSKPVRIQQIKVAIEQFTA
jgi:CheY-like chemotaxis protein